MLLSLIKTSGHSMEPKIKNGSFFMVSSIPYLFSKPKIGDVVVFKNKEKLIVKEISKIDSEKYFIKGKNLIDSKNFDPLDRNEILGKLIWIF